MSAPRYPWHPTEDDYNMTQRDPIMCPPFERAELVAYWKTRPPASNEYLAAEIIEELERELHAAVLCAGVASKERGEWAVERDADAASKGGSMSSPISKHAELNSLLNGILSRSEYIAKQARENAVPSEKAIAEIEYSAAVILDTIRRYKELNK